MDQQSSTRSIIINFTIYYTRASGWYVQSYQDVVCDWCCTIVQISLCWTSTFYRGRGKLAFGPFGMEVSPLNLTFAVPTKPCQICKKHVEYMGAIFVPQVHHFAWYFLKRVPAWRQFGEVSWFKLPLCSATQTDRVAWGLISMYAAPQT